MSQKTPIEWCDSTVNPTSGCDGCEILDTCYASTLHETRLAKAFPEKYAARFSEVRLLAGRMRKAAGWADLTGTERPDKPWLNGLPRLVFISDMSDALSRDVPFEFLRDEIVATVAQWKHIGLWLTKRPERMAAFDRWLAKQGIAWPANLWAGTSITKQSKTRRISELLKVRAAVRFLSVEPMLSAVDISSGTYSSDGDGMVWDAFGQSAHVPHGREPVSGPAIHWVIGGGESGPKARPMQLDWIRGLRDQCAAADVPFFFKQWGAHGTAQPAHEYARKHPQLYHWWDKDTVSPRLGKDAAGALLDGREHRAMPRLPQLPSASNFALAAAGFAPVA